MKRAIYSAVAGTSSIKLVCGLHIIAVVILVTFALSHFAFLSIPDSSHYQINTVFPFFKNKIVYMLAGVLETLTGVTCLIYLGRESTNICILIFVGVIAWYRWAFYFTGGIQCGCLGLLGKLFHLSKREEGILPIAALTLLALTTTPWLYLKFRTMLRSALRSAPLQAILVLLICGHSVCRGEITLRGEIHSAHYNPITGNIFTNSDVTADFAVGISKNSWRICLTNRANEAFWEVLLWDGTNTFTLGPEGGNYYRNQPPGAGVFVTISPSPFYYSEDEDDLGLAPMWLTFGLSPIAISTNQHGIVDLPLIWRFSRKLFEAHGYRWILGDWIDGRFMSDIQVVRDHSLDLPEKKELLRYDMDGPTTLNDYNDFRRSMKYQKEIQDGFIEASYHCSEWYHTNNISIPISSEFEWYVAPGPRRRIVGKPKPTYVATLKTSFVKIAGDSVEISPGQSTPSETRVHDYRYRKVNEKRVFQYADYKLHPGDSWKAANDATLLATAADWLEHGRKYDDFGLIFGIPPRTLISWLLLAILAMVPAIILIWKQKKQTTNK